MGDRANIKMVYDKGQEIYFYTHWDGSVLLYTLKAAMIRGKDRWSDPGYLARIIFSEMIQFSVLEETGYGIAPYVCDNNHPIISVNSHTKTITVEGVGEWTFDEFIKLVELPKF
jgi:hypothetical protein